MKQSAISLVFLFISTFVIAQNLIPYRVGDQWGYAAEGGEIVIEPQYEEAGAFRAKITWVKKDGKYAYIDKEGRAVTRFKFDEANYFGFGTARVKEGKESYCIGLNGKKTDCVVGCGGAISVLLYFQQYKLDGKVGLLIRRPAVDSSGQSKMQIDTLPPAWDGFVENHDGYAAVKKGDSWGVINKKGELVTPYQYDSIAAHPTAYKRNHYFLTVLNDTYGFLNDEGREVVEPKYHKAEFFTSSGIAKVWLDDEFWGYIDEQGREYFQREPYSASIKKYRQKHIEDLLSGERAPIDKKQAKKLKFYEPDESYRVTATFKRTPDEEAFEMATYSGITKPYVKYGEIHFVLQGDSLQLAIYQSLRLRQIPMYRDYLFLPFKDATNGEASYGGGRYIDIRVSEIKENRLIVDFNKAYNPYCAYSDGYNCPVPPLENHLEVEVEAGERKFKM